MFRNIIKISFKTLEHSKIPQKLSVNLHVKCYSRWVHRRPVAILNEDELFDPKETEGDTRERPVRRRGSRQVQNKQPVAEKKKDETIKKSIKDIPPFEIIKDEKVINSLMMKVKSRKRRQKNDSIFLEGFRLIKDGIEAGAVPEVIMFSREIDLRKLPLTDTDAKLYKIPYRTIQLWSNLETSPGVIGIFRTPNVHDKQPAEDALPLTIICDNIREPGNLGSILRAAAGVGCERVILAKGCVDLWDPKVLRSAAGAHFRIPISVTNDMENIVQLISSTSSIFMADNNINIITEDNSKSLENSAEELNTSREDQTNSCNDTQETSSEILSKDSVNAKPVEEVQTEISRRESFTHDFKKIRTKFNKAGFEFSGKGRQIIRRLTSQLPVHSYYHVDYTQNEVVLVVSGETEGLTFPILELLHERNGTRINVPLSNGVDSLNNGVALGIVAFEIKRQFLSKMEE